MKRQIRVTLPFVALLAGVFLANGQEPVAPPVISVVPAATPTALRVMDHTQTQAPVLHFGRVACDANGSIYLRRYDFQRSKNNTLLGEPIQKMRADGSLEKNFDVTLDMPQFSANDFFVAPSGDVYVVGWEASGTRDLRYYVRRFAADASLKSTTEVKVGWRTFHPYKIAVFNTGEFLLTGLAGPHQDTPVTAVFDASGNALRNIYEPEDETSRLETEAQMPNIPNSTVSRGDVALGDDGNVYLIRASYPAVVFAISPSGEVIRKLKIDLGDPAWRPEAMKLSGGQLAVFFRKARGAGGILHILDLKGKLLASHSLDNRVPASFLGCYAPPATFTFTGPDASANFIQLFRVEPN